MTMPTLYEDSLPLPTDTPLIATIYLLDDPVPVAVQLALPGEIIQVEVEREWAWYYATAFTLDGVQSQPTEPATKKRPPRKYVCGQPCHQ